MSLHKEYFTVIKGESENKDKPEECWAVTNKFNSKFK